MLFLKVLFIYCVCVCAHAMVQLWRPEEICGSQFSPSTTWVLEMELGSSGLVAGTFSHQTTPSFHFLSLTRPSFQEEVFQSRENNIRGSRISNWSIELEPCRSPWETQCTDSMATAQAAQRPHTSKERELQAWHLVLRTYFLFLCLSHRSLCPSCPYWQDPTHRAHRLWSQPQLHKEEVEHDKVMTEHSRGGKPSWSSESQHCCALESPGNLGRIHQEPSSIWIWNRTPAIPTCWVGFLAPPHRADGTYLFASRVLNVSHIWLLKKVCWTQAVEPDLDSFPTEGLCGAWESPFPEAS